MSTRSIARRVRAVYEFITTHRDKYDVRTMCRVLGVAPSGYYNGFSTRCRIAAKRMPGSFA
jgi:hypothetical protein